MLDYNKILENEENLDPENWEDYKTLAHKMVEDIFTFLQTLRDQPVWKKPPEPVKDFLNTPLPVLNQKWVAGIW